MCAVALCCFKDLCVCKSFPCWRHLLEWLMFVTFTWRKPSVTYCDHGLRGSQCTLLRICLCHGFSLSWRFSARFKLETLYLQCLMQLYLNRKLRESHSSFSPLVLSVQIVYTFTLKLSLAVSLNILGWTKTPLEHCVSSGGT